MSTADKETDMEAIFVSEHPEYPVRNRHLPEDP